MCGRVNVSDNDGVRLLLESFGMTTWPSRDPRFNVAPTQTLDVVKFDDKPVLMPMSWGLSMSVKGAKGQTIIKRVPNARDDKVWSSYLWRSLMPEQRVLVPVNGYYEWKRENKKRVQAYYVTPASSAAMFIAGIYKLSDNDSLKPDVSIITTVPNETMSEVHHRMPVILSSQNEAMAWIQETDKDSISALMRPASNDALVFTEVSDYVNKSSNEGPECVAPMAYYQRGLI
jgi:putative SOS response-associated peptidase YedK